ncbi:MAG: AMP-binding protein [Terriglobales bacterium]
MLFEVEDSLITGDILGERARITPDSVALIEVRTGREFTYRQLDERATACARGWIDRCGLRAKERVGILAENRVEFIEAFCAAGKSGIILVPLSTRNTAHELAHIVSDSGMRCLMYSSQYEATVEELRSLAPVDTYIRLDTTAYTSSDCSRVEGANAGSIPLRQEITPEDIYCLLYTSGTTGRPKGVMIPHRQIAWNAYNTVISWQLRDNDSMQIFTPLYHAGGLAVCLTPLFAIGGRIILHDGFDAAEVLRVFDEYRCSIIFGVPTIFKLLMEAPEFAAVDFGHARWCISGGAPLPRYIITAYQERGVTFKQGYGLTEVGVNCFAMTASDSVRKPGSIGNPMMFTQAKLVGGDGKGLEANEVGELCLRGPHVSLGYWNNEAATAEVLDADGWFHTGDLAQRDEEGFFYIAGRLKEMIISGGVNVYPAEIEAELLQHEAIKDAAVIGIADEKWGEVPIAFLVLQAGSALTGEEINEFLAKKLSKIKLPRRFEFMEALPRNAYGKALKNELRSLVSARSPSAGLR